MATRTASDDERRRHACDIRTRRRGDTHVDFGKGLEINARWLALHGAARERVVEGLRPLLERPVERVLATHGGPTGSAALAAALS